MWTRRLLCIVIISISIQPTHVLAAEKTVPKNAPSKQESVARFLTKYCIDCHSTESAEGEREFETFRLPIDSEEHLVTADEIVDQVTLRLMPPEDALQPDVKEQLALTKSLRNAMADARVKLESTGGRTVMRRLSHREYENTLATLFDRRVDTLGLTADFPKENTEHHVDTIGESMVTSGFLLDQYFQAASRLVQTRLGEPKPKPKSWHFKDNFRQYEELTGSHKSVFNFEYLCLYEQPNTDTRQGGYGHIEDFLEGVPASGNYDIEILAQAMHRDTHYDPKIFRIDFSEPFQIAVVPGDVTKGHIHYPQSVEPVLATSVVPDESPEWLKFTVWLEAGQTPRFVFPNGPYESRASVIESNKRYKKEFKNPQDGVSRKTLLLEGALPHIRIGEIKIRGPLEEPKGTKEERSIFGDEGFRPESALQQLLEFARRAYRRPLTENDRKRIQTFYKQRNDSDSNSRQAALDTITMILCSPSFLYLSEITQPDQTELLPHDLASRLSYALWAAPPDQKLSDAAQSGRLGDSEELSRQIERLVSDPRSSAFIDGFLDSWLNLRDIGNLPPPRKATPNYYAENLPESMKREAALFFRHLLDTDGPITDFLDSDYTFVDKKLAKLYGLPNAKTMRLSDGFQRVSLDDNRQRGGILGMAAVLTVSANGVDTSPVTRGVWISENILGITPPPPPDEVPAIDSDVRGAKTIRDRLTKHSQDKACYVCHRKIDPLGYALETFDPIGRYRKKYPKVKGNSGDTKIDSSGQLPSGEEFHDIASFRQVIAEHRLKFFARNLVSTLLAYASGRRMEPSDRFEIEDIQERVAEQEYGLRALVTEVLTSQIFRTR